MDGQRIEVIARAIAEDGTKTKILFCAPKNEAYYYLPGGHVEFGERANEALAREIFEETGIKTESSEYRLVGSDENIFTQDGTLHHEINLYFGVKEGVLESMDVVSQEEHIVFRWLNKKDIGTLPVFPESLKTSLSMWKNGDTIMKIA